MRFWKNWLRPAPENHYVRYAALGDSISTDDYPGLGKGAASLLYRNQDHLYPDYRGMDLCTLNPELQFLNLAKDGASSRDVLYEQLPELGNGGKGKTVVTLTAGGNDILAKEFDAEEILFRIRTILDRIQQIYAQSEIVVGTIYDPSDGIGDLFGSEILEEELRVAHAVNNGIRRLARPPSIRIAEIHKHFLGHGIHCKDPSSEFFHPEDPSLWYVLTIEPNSRGAHEIRSLFWKALHAEVRP